MGGLSFIIYNENYKSYNIDFTNSFLKMKNRGPDNTSYLIEHSQNINTPRISNDMLKMHLSRSELAQYSMHTFIYNYHQLCVNDSSLDASQPYEDPILHKIKVYPDLKTRPRRKLLCDGEIYNYTKLKDDEKFTDKDLQSQSDVEIILPLYIKYGIEKTLNMLNGDFSCIITENINTFVLSTLNVFCARDRYGVRPLWYINNNDNSFHMFTSDINSIPENLSKQTNTYNIKEVPPGTYWSFQTKKFHSYVDNTMITKTMIDKTDPDTLQNIYTNIHTLLNTACRNRLYTKNDCGILVDTSDFNSCLLTSVLLSQYELIHSRNTIHLFILNRVYNNIFISFIENTYKTLNIRYHHIYSNNQIYGNLDNNPDDSNLSLKSIKSFETFDDKNLNDLYKYIKNINAETTSIKVIYSGYGLNKIWNNIDFVNLAKYEYEAGLNGFQIRFPYIDTEFINYISCIDHSLKEKRSLNSTTMIVDKYLIRKSLENYLPFDITWNYN
jgi:hypothetical protein